MTKLAALLSRKTATVTETGASPAAQPTEPKSELEIDQELFFPIATQLGGENEAVRNLLIDAEHKISELDTIKKSIGRLVDPVSKTLRAFEEAKSEKLSLQSVLNSTRLTNAKLRDDLGAVEKKAVTLETECARLREVLAVAQQNVVALETTRSELSAELTARRAQIADLQQHVQQQATELQTTRTENQRVSERVAASERRVVQLEADATAAHQKFLLSDKERTALQSVLDKTLNEQAQLSRRLLDAETALKAARARLAQLEIAFADVQAQRAKLATALDEANERHRNESTAHNARYEALQARAELGDKLLDEARQALAARADEIGAFNRRVGEITLVQETNQQKLAQAETLLIEREQQIRDLDQIRATLTEQKDELLKAVSTRENAYNRAQEKILSQEELIQLLEAQLRADREAAAMHADELNAQLQRERLERSMAEGALEAGRRDIARLLRELGVLDCAPAKAASQPQQAAAAALRSAA